jgi:hypothetical protein
MTSKPNGKGSDPLEKLQTAVESKGRLDSIFLLSWIWQCGSGEESHVDPYQTTMITRTR